MKKQHSNRNILLGISFCVILAFTAMAFQDSSKVNKQQKQVQMDTVPKTHDIDIQLDLKDFDKTIKKSLEMAEKSMKDIDWNNISKQIELSMKQLDMAKIQSEINNSMKAIDWNKIQSEIDRSMKEVDMNKLQLDIQKKVNGALKNIDKDALKKSLEEIKNINFDDLKKEMENLKKEMEINKDQFKLEMDKAKLEMEKAKIGMNEIKEMTTEMAKDGLLNKKESNTIEYKNKKLLINGRKQSPEVTEKYRKYFKGDNFTFTFKGED